MRTTTERSETRPRRIAAAATAQALEPEASVSPAPRSHTHASTSAGLRYQIDHARRTLRRRFHAPVRWFCYPSGQYDATVIDAVRAAGFVGSTTVVPGWASRSDDPYALPRLRVLGGTTGSELIAQITAARDQAAPPGEYETN